MQKPYTVVGIYADNQQPWMEHVMANNPKAAAIKGINQLSKSDDQPDPDDLYVVEVIEGKVKGVLCNDEPLSLEKLKEK